MHFETIFILKKHNHNSQLEMQGFLRCVWSLRMTVSEVEGGIKKVVNPIRNPIWGWDTPIRHKTQEYATEKHSLRNRDYVEKCPLRQPKPPQDVVNKWLLGAAPTLCFINSVFKQNLNASRKFPETMAHGPSIWSDADDSQSVSVNV